VISPDDVLRVLWEDGTETFTMLRQVGSHDVLATVSRQPGSKDLHCHTCHTTSVMVGGCECINAARAYCNKRERGAG
jgi:hypothetical protein